MNEILLTKGYALGWFWLKKVPHQQTKTHIHNPTRPTDNPTNLIRNCNPKKYQNKY